MYQSCATEGCTKPKAPRALLCAGHRWRKSHGKDMFAPFRDMSGNTEAQFWVKVGKTSSCWLWLAYKDKKGYGRHGKVLAHRYSYERSHGPIPEGLLLDHLCWNRACVNPEHLRPVTAQQNQQNRRGANHRSKSGIRGVFQDNRSGLWRAEVTVDYEQFSVGRFSTVEEAAQAVSDWRREHMTHSEMDKKKEQVA